MLTSKGWLADSCGIWLKPPDGRYEPDPSSMPSKSPATPPANPPPKVKPPPPAPVPPAVCSRHRVRSMMLLHFESRWRKSKMGIVETRRQIESGFFSQHSTLSPAVGGAMATLQCLYETKCHGTRPGHLFAEVLSGGHRGNQDQV